MIVWAPGRQEGDCVSTWIEAESPCKFDATREFSPRWARALGPPGWNDAIQAISSSSRVRRCCDARCPGRLVHTRISWVVERGRYRHCTRRCGSYFYGRPQAPGVDIPRHRQDPVRAPWGARLVVGRQGRRDRASEMASRGPPAGGRHRRDQDTTWE
jgi:hypothetical protein